MYKNVTYFISGFMIIMCLIFAGYLLFTDLILQTLFGPKRQIMIAMLLLYAFYRGYRLYIGIRNDRKEKR
ncbi:hypothetical protein [Fluviicola sp.]|uniref:hypothetical protein n=1 Tax=Fluviicola sp. TaxID=1917219 RepID=UPI00260A6583|nr:hypothetical protein [Fluviicola sp.]